jgi:hypothetical protein
MNIFKKIFKQITCHHSYLWRRNIYGDEINMVNGDRSWWKCANCGKMKTDKNLFTNGRE